MLRSLKINNFALIDKAEITFSQGLNVITGETGAGKSIFIESLKIIYGERINSGIIGKKSDSTFVEAVFDNVNDELRRFLEESAIEVEEDKLIIIRKISRTEKNTIVVNGMQVTLSMLKQISEYLMDLHGQHEHQNLLRSEKYWQFVDGNDKKINAVFLQYQKCFNLWSKTKKENFLLKQRSQEKQQRENFLRWQIDEINAAAPQKDEDQKLEVEIKMLANSEKIGRSLKNAYELLRVSRKNSDSIIDKLQLVKNECESLVSLIPQLYEKVGVINDAYYALDDIANMIRELAENLEYDPIKLDKMNARLFAIEKIKRKYGFKLDEVFEYYKAITDELNELENFDDILISKQQEEDKLLSELMEHAHELSRCRTERAKDLSDKITVHLLELGMMHAKFSIQVSKVESFTLTGNDKISFFFSANAGENLKPLQKVASGGELSRIALALKSVIKDTDNLGTMIFDEIDTGIGGKTGKLVAEKIAKLSKSVQILCITHLPQIACYADNHIYIEKNEDISNTFTKIRLLSQDERPIEIGRMTGLDGLEYASELKNDLSVSVNTRK